MPAVQSGWSPIKIKQKQNSVCIFFKQPSNFRGEGKNPFGLCSCSYAVANISKETIWWYWCYSFLVSHFQIIQVFNMKRYKWVKIWILSNETNMTFFLVAHHWQKGLSVVKSRKKEGKKGNLVSIDHYKMIFENACIFFLMAAFPRGMLPVFV